MAPALNSFFALSKLYHGIIVAEVNANPIIQEAKCLIIQTAPLRQVHRTKKC